MDKDAVIAALEETGEFRVLRRFAPEFPSVPIDPQERRLGVVLDVETTGLNHQSDRIIQLSLLPFQFHRETGRLGRVHEGLTYFEDPGAPIPSEIVQLTGITDADVAGQRIDDDAVEKVLSGCHLVIAHNARFDRRFAERRFPSIAKLPWACSMNDVDWNSHGISSAALEFILFKHCGVFFDGHRADADCAATLFALSSCFPSGQSALSVLLEAARKNTVRLWATRASYDLKDILKARGYRWSNGEDGRTKAWYRDLSDSEEAEECAWLADTIYGGREGWRREMFDARRRYAEGY